MSLPEFPITTSLSREEAINQIISSIAMEELGLSHIINAEGEKLQYVLGTIPGISGPSATIDDVLKVNESVRAVLQSAAENQSLLRNKLQNVLSSAVLTGPTGPTGIQGPTTISISPDVGRLEPDATPTVEDAGPGDQNVILKFGIPRGATGGVGPTGPTGPNTLSTFAYIYNTAAQSVAPQSNAQFAQSIPAALPTGISFTGPSNTINISMPGTYSVRYYAYSNDEIIFALIADGTTEVPGSRYVSSGDGALTGQTMLVVTAPITLTLRNVGATDPAVLVDKAPAVNLSILIERIGG